ncbi:MAG TPA: CDP-alcohol phosphatidyltransferase family protein [Bauldia sp.]|nr:CDP-alcohol phosphatidyltransferase family protein [Bauldia sp.]
MDKVGAFAVHLLTAAGAALALAAALGAARGEWRFVFLCLGIALIVDAVDGPLARRFDIKSRLPWFDGAALDFVVDYSTYVFVPAFILATSSLLSRPVDLVVGVVVAIVGALYFADRRMKTEDQAFRGFPAVWNGLVFILIVFSPPEWVTLVVIALCAILTFAPVEFVHPVRVVALRPLTLMVTALWSVLAIIALIDDLDPSVPVKIALGLATLYLAGIGAVLQLRRSRMSANPGGRHKG